MPADKPRSNSFHVDAVLFDMDGTLTDSIAAVEAAWGKVADDLNLPRADVIAATHGRRATDNLAALKPHIKPHEMEAEVEAFERTILAYADAYNGRRTRPRISDASVGAPSPASSTASGSAPSSRSSSFTSHFPGVFAMTSMDAADTPPSLTPDSSNPSSRRSSTSAASSKRKNSFAHDQIKDTLIAGEETVLPALIEDTLANIPKSDLANDVHIALEAEAEEEDRSIRVLPGVHRIINALPEGKYAVATSGAKTYAHGAMTRVGITPPAVTITADDKRLKAGKPHPDPFLLAAKELGYPAPKCVVFEDSPAGIRAGVASGATVVAVATSHEKSQIQNCGAHYVVDDLECVDVEVEGDRLKFTIRE